MPPAVLPTIPINEPAHVNGICNVLDTGFKFFCLFTCACKICLGNLVLHFPFEMLVNASFNAPLLHPEGLTTSTTWPVTVDPQGYLTPFIVTASKVLALKYCPTWDDFALIWSIIESFNVGIFTISSCSIRAFFSIGQTGHAAFAVWGFLS